MELRNLTQRCLSENPNGRKKYYFVYTILFIIMSAFVFLPFMVKKNSFVGLSDGYNQLYPALIYIGRYVREFIPNLLHGKILQYDFNIGYGNDIMGTLNYVGFGSPFSLLSAFVPVKGTVYLYSFLMILKLYLSGISLSSFVFYKHKNVSDRALLIGVFVYLFSGYTFYYGTQLFTPFLDIMIYLPFISKSILRKHKSETKIDFCFIFCIFATAVTGFSFLYMISIYMVIFYLTTAVVEKHSFKKNLCNIGNLIGQYLIGVAVSAPILIPTLYAYLNCSRTEESNFNLLSLVSLPEIDNLLIELKNFLLPTGYEIGLGLPVFSVICVILLFTAKKNNQSKILFIIFLTGYFLPGFGRIMNGFAYTTDRWEFMLCFVIAVGITESLCYQNIVKRYYVGVTVLCFFVWTVSYLNLHKWNVSSMFRLTAYLVLWGSLILILVQHIRKQYSSLSENCAFCSYCLCAIAVAAFLVNAPVKLGGDGWSAAFKSFDECQEMVENADIKLKQENAFARIDIKGASMAQSLLGDYAGTSSYFSIQNAGIYDFYRELCISPGLWGSSFSFKGLNERSDLQNMLAVENDEMDIPFGYTYERVIDEQTLKDVFPLQKQELLTKAAIVSEYSGNVSQGNPSELSSEYEELGSDIVFYNIDREGEAVYHTMDENSIEITFQTVAEENTEYYIYFENMKISKGLWQEVTVGGTSFLLCSEENAAFLQGEYNYLVHIEDFDENGKVKVELPSGIEFQLDKIRVYQYHSMNIEEKRELYKNSLQDVHFGINEVSGMLRTDTNALLYVSIPYSKAWTAYIDGEKVKTYKTNYGFTGVDVLPGTHEIYFKYRTPGLLMGSVLCVMGVFTMIVYEKLCARGRKRCE